ncbi:MAG: VWA domain-containing protein [Kofleriaceae bacterium]
MRRIALAALLVTSAAAAKSQTATDDDVRETAPVAIRAKLDGTTARMSVDLQLVTAADSTSSTYDIPLPFGAVVAGATIHHRGIAHPMSLDTTQNVEKQFEVAFDNTGSSPTPRTWVAKIEPNVYGIDGIGVTLVLGAPKASELRVTLEVTAPTCFYRDARWVRVPASWGPRLRARAPSDGLVAACSNNAGQADTPFAWASFAAPQAARMPTGERLRTSTARLAIDNSVHLARTELAIAASIADVPPDLATVILVDESRSMDDKQRKAQREIVVGYLRAAPSSRVQVIAFSRRTHALLPSWTTASRALPRIERELASMTPRNGSNFDLGLADAGRLLSAINGTRRVLLITDEALASRLATRPERLARLVPDDTIINIAVPGVAGAVDDSGEEVLARHDNARLAQLAAVTTGFATSIGGSEPQQRRSVDATMLVRPISLDHLRATGLGWTELDSTERDSLGGHTCEGSLAAGESCVWWTRGSKFASTIQLEGLLWNRRVVRIARPLADLGHSIAREIVGTNTSIIDEQPDVDGDGITETSKRIDLLAHAVTNSTSLFVRWGSAEPFPEGMLFGGRGGFGRGGSIDSIRDVAAGPLVRAASIDLAPQLRPLVASCGLGSSRADIQLELTFGEIVAVDVTIDATGARAAAIRTCIEDVVWDFAPVLPSLEPLREATVRL